MTFLKTAFLKGALVAAVTSGALAAASAASADVVCNGQECWHVHDRLTYPPGVSMTYHDDAWADAHRDAHWRWRHDRFDHGYYRNGVWITF